jgi:hypothetical protein
MTSIHLGKKVFLKKLERLCFYRPVSGYVFGTVSARRNLCKGQFLKHVLSSHPKESNTCFELKGSLL